MSGKGRVPAVPAGGYSYAAALTVSASNSGNAKSFLPAASVWGGAKKPNGSGKVGTLTQKPLTGVEEKKEEEEKEVREEEEVVVEEEIVVAEKIQQEPPQEAEDHVTEIVAEKESEKENTQQQLSDKSPPAPFVPAVDMVEQISCLEGGELNGRQEISKERGRAFKTIIQQWIDLMNAPQSTRTRPLPAQQPQDNITKYQPRNATPDVPRPSPGKQAESPPQKEYEHWGASRLALWKSGSDSTDAEKQNGGASQRVTTSVEKSRAGLNPMARGWEPSAEQLQRQDLQQKQQQQQSQLDAATLASLNALSMGQGVPFGVGGALGQGIAGVNPIALAQLNMNPGIVPFAGLPGGMMAQPAMPFPVMPAGIQDLTLQAAAALAQQQIKQASG